MKYSLVIPVYNEAPIIVDTLRALHEEFSRHDSCMWEIIVVDNASTDATRDVILKACVPNVSLITLSEKGKGRALRAGFAVATGSLVGFTDADLSVPPHEIVNAFFEFKNNNNVDVVIGSRFHVKSTHDGREWWRTSSSHVFNALACIIVGVHASDTQCPLKVMNKEGTRILLATKENTWFLDLEFIALLESLHTPFIEVPVSWDEHRYLGRASKLSFMKDGLGACIAMVRIRTQRATQMRALNNALKKEFN